MENNLQVISLDPKKVWYEAVNNRQIVHKRTSYQEKDNLLKAKNFLTNKGIKINNIPYSIQVPNIYAWNENTNILSMSYCQGENLELLLRNPHTRQRAIPFLQSTMRFILAQHFYWQDYAPRNIIIGDETIYLIDFEKGLDFSINDLQTFFRNHVFEEYSSFLLPNERLISSEQIFLPSMKEKNKKIDISDIQVKRIKSVAIALGYTDTISMEEYLTIQKMILKAEEPFYYGTELIFPRVQLVKMLENKGTNPSVYQKYANEILLRNNIVPRQLTIEKAERD
jgi:tRNA A-37 threonylcarbamoyl transferase component Bud32